MKRLAPLLALFLALPALAEDAPPSGGGNDKAAAGDQAGPPPAGRRQAPGARRSFEPKEMAAQTAQHIGKALGLNDEQTKKVQAIVERDAAKKLQLEKQLQAMERRQHEEIRAVLNDEQKEKWDMMRARQDLMMERMRGGGMMMGGMGGMRGGPGMGGPGMGMGGPGMGGPGMGPGMQRGMGPGGRPGQMGAPQGEQPAGPPPGGGDDGQ